MLLGLSAIECYIIIVAIFAIVYLFTSRKNIWLPFFVITVLFTILAYHLEPDPADDLITYYHHMDVFRSEGKAGIDYALEENWFEWKTYRVSLYYFYFISRFPNNHYLSAVTILIVYTLGFYVLYKAANKFEVNKINLFFASMFFISTYWYYDTASGVRNGLAFAVAFACAYQHFAERKNIIFCYVGYVLAIFMHSSGVVAVILSVITLLTYKSNSKFINFILVFGLSVGGALIEYLSTVTDNSFIQSLAGEVSGHVTDATMASGTRFYVNISVLFLIALMLLYFSNYIQNCTFAGEARMLYKYMSVVVFFCIGTIFSHLVFIRFARWILPLAGSLLFMIGTKAQSQVEEDYYCDSMANGRIPVQSLHLRLRPVVYIVYVGYTAVHFWYSLNGSSLVWLHFAD